MLLSRLMLLRVTYVLNVFSYSLQISEVALLTNAQPCTTTLPSLELDVIGVELLIVRLESINVQPMNDMFWPSLS